MLLTGAPASGKSTIALELERRLVDTAVEDCERRDPKGLHARTRAGEIRGFTGVDAPYEPPEQPELRLDTSTTGVEQAVAQIIEILRPRSGSKRRGPR